LEDRSAQEFVVLTEAQVMVLEEARAIAAPRTHSVDNLKRVGRVYQETFISPAAKSPAPSCRSQNIDHGRDLLSGLLPLFDEHNVKLPRVLCTQ
jgi:hypothetical protein